MGRKERRGFRKGWKKSRKGKRVKGENERLMIRERMKERRRQR